MEKKAELIIDGKSYYLPMVEGTEQERGLDISKLRAESGCITLDVGYKNTGSTQSDITFINGEEGILRHRGYSIEDLCENSSFIEVAYLLIYGELPTKEELEEFDHDVRTHTIIHEDLKHFFDAYPQKAHPMGVLVSMVSSLSLYYPESLNPNPTDEEIDRHARRLIAKITTIAAQSYKNSMGHPMMYPDNNLSYAENFLHMMFALPTQEYEVPPNVAKALDLLLILHADHEQNCSASTVRMVGSSHANIYASISAGISALWGPLHGGANQAVIEMLNKIEEDGGDVSKWIDKAKDKDDPFRLMGFGHRVYKNYDPRAKIIKAYSDEVLKELNVNKPILDIARELEERALSDDYFAEKKLYPNVDFYSGIIYKAMGIPTEMFPVLFAIGRLPGWIAQWKEMREGKEPINRPRQIYTGYTERKYVPVEKR